MLGGIPEAMGLTKGITLLSSTSDHKNPSQSNQALGFQISWVIKTFSVPYPVIIVGKQSIISHLMWRGDTQTHRHKIKTKMD